MIEYQLVKAGTSVGANYREANRGESRADFIHKIAIVEKECSESGYWLEICDEASLGDVEKWKWLLAESRELLCNLYQHRKKHQSKLCSCLKKFRNPTIISRRNSKSEIRNSKKAAYEPIK